MINRLYFFVTLALGISGLLFFVPSATAECNRNDVEYFLKKGFSREQVTAICEVAKPQRFGESTPQNQEDYEAYNKQLEARLRIERKLQKEEDDILLLKTAIAGEDVKITADWLDFKSPFCIAAGNNPDVEARVRVCPLVLYRIYFKGLQVKEYQRKYVIFGKRELEVEGTIKRKLLNDLRGYPPGIRMELLDAYKANVRKGGTFIPIRKDYPINKVQQVLRSYALRAEE
ncbi:MAG: hypothetical protein GDA45_00860 [Chromatiales bacterium]|nr:hypothetical protein [Chromatiales bacterium]